MPGLLSSNVIGRDHYREIVSQTLGCVAGIVGDTLGPYGSTAIVQDANLQHFATKDGYSVLRKLFFKEALPRTVLDLLKRISFRLVRTVGDGSSSAVVAANELYRSLCSAEGLRELPPKDVVDALSAISEVLREEIAARAVPAAGRLRDVAYISANNDGPLADMISSIFSDAGPECSVAVEPGNSSKTAIERTSGIELDRGIINPYFATAVTETGVKCEMQKAFVFMCDDILSGEDMQLVGACMQQVVSLGQPFVVVAKGFDAQFRDFLHSNKVSNPKLPISAVDVATESASSFSRFEDLATYLGAQPLSKYKNEKLNSFSLDRLGKCASFKATDSRTQFLGGGGHPIKIAERAKMLREQMLELAVKEDHIERDPDIHMLRKRIAALTDGMVVVRVGGETPQEIETRRFLVEDAVFACQSAIKHGVIMGGNLAAPKLLNDLIVRNRCVGAISSRTFLTEEDGEALCNAVSDAFKAVFLKVISFVSNPLTYARLCKKAPEMFPFDTNDAATEIAATCCKDWETVFDAKAVRMESFPSTAIINSAETDVEIIRSVFSIIGILATSGQFVSTSLIDMSHLE